MPDAETLTPDHPLVAQITKALAGVNDPEIRRPITDLGMVKRIDIADGGRAEVEVLLTVAGCPLKDTLRRDVTAAVTAVPGIEQVDVTLGVMSDEQRASLRDSLKGGRTDKDIPFAKPDSLTKVIAIASGKGGVGKSSVTVNLAMALAAHGQTVGVLDADIYGHSVPAMLGIADARPTSVEDMIMPVPSNGLKVMSIGMLKPRRDQVVAWRGPILDRALHQMLADVYWGDLDYLLLDLPPGTGDVAISIGQKLPNAEVIVVTTPQQAASEVAERAGTMASMVNQRVIGVVENMSYLLVSCPDCGKQHRYDVFGTGGGEEVAGTLSTRLGYDVPLLAQVPLDPRLRAGGDDGVPLVTSDPQQPAAQALSGLADALIRKGRGLAGRRLNLQPVGR
jgi:ATP-binding protein involved in chromosome partitioning